MWLLMRLSLPLRVVRSTSMTSVAVHELIHGRRRPRVALLIDLIEQPHPYLLGFLGGVVPAGTVSLRSMRLPVSGSSPA